jgi:hypothetical protein
MNESPVFTKTHDLLLWLLLTTRKFPRDQRFVQAFALQDALVAAGLDPVNRLRHLALADCALAGLRKTLLLCHEMQLLSDGQYRHVSGLTAEVGRLMGSWIAKKD